MISVVGDAVGATRTKLAFEAMLQDIARIARLSEPVLRNLLITLRYHDLVGARGRPNERQLGHLRNVGIEDGG